MVGADDVLSGAVAKGPLTRGGVTSGRLPAIMGVVVVGPVEVGPEGLGPVGLGPEGLSPLGFGFVVDRPGVTGLLFDGPVGDSGVPVVGLLRFGFELSGLVARFCGEVAVDNDGEEFSGDGEGLTLVGLPVVGPPARGLADSGPLDGSPPDGSPVDSGLPANPPVGPAEGLTVVGFVVTDPGEDGAEGDDADAGPVSTCPAGASIGGAMDDRLTPEFDGAGDAAGVADAVTLLSGAAPALTCTGPASVLMPTEGVDAALTVGAAAFETGAAACAAGEDAVAGDEADECETGADEAAVAEAGDDAGESLPAA